MNRLCLVVFIDSSYLRPPSPPTHLNGFASRHPGVQVLMQQQQPCSTFRRMIEKSALVKAGLNSIGLSFLIKMSQPHTEESLMELTYKELVQIAKRTGISDVTKLKVKKQIVEKILQEQQIMQAAANDQPHEGIPGIRLSNAAGGKGQPVAALHSEPQIAHSPQEQKAAPPRGSFGAGGGGQHGDSQTTIPLRPIPPGFASDGDAFASNDSSDMQFHETRLLRTPTIPPSQKAATSRNVSFGAGGGGQHGDSQTTIPLRPIPPGFASDGDAFASNDSSDMQFHETRLLRTPTIPPSQKAATSRNVSFGAGGGGQHGDSQTTIPLRPIPPGFASDGDAFASNDSSDFCGSVLSPIRHQNSIIPPTKKSSTYSSVVVNLSGRQHETEMHIGTEKLVEKLTMFFRKSGRYEEEERAWGLSRPDLIFNITGTARPPNSYHVQRFIELWPQEASRDLGDEPQRSNPNSAVSNSWPQDNDVDGSIDEFMKDWPQLWFYKRLKNYITEVIFGIADRKRSCWIMDGGTNAGIMSLLGRMRHEHFAKHSALHSSNEFPLIGFSDLGILRKDHLPEFDDRPLVQSMLEERGSGVSFAPERNHTHHVFVHSKGLKCGSANTHDHHFLLRHHLHLAREFEFKCPIVRRVTVHPPCNP
jgi:hypothetical protein